MGHGFEDVLAKLDRMKGAGWGWMARCPAHEDNRTSLSVRIGKDTGDLLLKCHAGCKFDDILAAIGVDKSACYGKRANTVSKEIAHYDYKDEAGKLLFQVVRFEPKDFRQRRPVGSGWEWGLNGTRRVLYRLPELIASPKRTVLLVEGEKDADRLVKEGFLATCNPMGAGKWEPGYTTSLKDRTVVIIPDADKPGQEHAANVKKCLNDQSTVCVLRLNAKDVSEWLNLGHTGAELKELCKQALKTAAVLSELRALDLRGKLTAIRQLTDDLDDAAFATANVKPVNTKA